MHCHCLKLPHLSLLLGCLFCLPSPLLVGPHAAHQRDGKVLVSSLQVLYRFLYRTLNTGVARSVVVNSDRIFLIHLSFTEKQFTNEWEGFKQHISLKFTNGTKKTQTRNVLTEERLDEIGVRLETSLRNFYNNFYRQQVCLCHHDTIKHNCCMCPHSSTVIHTLPGRLWSKTEFYACGRGVCWWNGFHSYLV
jgi:hypothetical protein